MPSPIISLFSNAITLFSSDIIGNSCGGSIFGLEPWYYYLPKSALYTPPNSHTTQCSIAHFKFLGPQNNIVPVLLAVVDDLLRVAGTVAVAFVIVGAFRYVASQGDPEGTAKAQSTIINALIGTVIAVVAISFVDFLGKQLG